MKFPPILLFYVWMIVLTKFYKACFICFILISVICQPGDYYDNSTSTCVACPIGQFQNTTGQSSCFSCPTDTTTESEGSTRVGDCKGENFDYSVRYLFMIALNLFIPFIAQRHPDLFCYIFLKNIWRGVVKLQEQPYSNLMFLLVMIYVKIFIFLADHVYDPNGNGLKDWFILQVL